MKKDHPKDKGEKVITQLLAHSDEFARQEPTKAVVSAFSIGLLLNFLPIGIIVGAVASLVFALARPILLFLGLLRVCDFYQNRKPTNPESL